MSEEGHQDTDLTKLLALGAKVKKQIYGELVRRVAGGAVLNAQELVTFQKLHGELSGPGETAPALALPNRRAVASYLRNQGYKVSQSNVYKHIQEGKLAARPEGYVLADVENYAKLYLSRRADVNQLDGIQKDRITEEIRKTRAQAYLTELRAAEAAGTLMPKDAFEKEIAARATIFRSDGTNWIHSEAPNVIEAVAGSPELLPDLIALMLTGLERWLARYIDDRDFTAELPAPASRKVPPDQDDELLEEAME